MKSIPIPDQEDVYHNDFFVQEQNPDYWYNTGTGETWHVDRVIQLLGQSFYDMTDDSWEDEQRTKKSLLDDMRQF